MTSSRATNHPPLSTEITPEDYSLLLHLDETVAPESLDKCKVDLFPTVTMRVGPDVVEVSATEPSPLTTTPCILALFFLLPSPLSSVVPGAVSVICLISRPLCQQSNEHWRPIRIHPDAGRPLER